MRKWMDLAAPDDPGAWYDIGAMWPTNRGSYETVDGYTTDTYTATACGTPVYSWCANVTPRNQYDPEYVFDGAKIWQYQPLLTAFADRTGTAAYPTVPDSLQAVQYGSITIVAMGATRSLPTGGALAGADTIYTTSATSNFAALAGAPRGMCACVQSNAVLMFWTEVAGGGTPAPDGWAASDVGDYTNWTTGEAASGRLIATPGGISAAVPFRNVVYAFKESSGGQGSIYRLQYVGGVVKWQSELVVDNIGCYTWKMACAGRDGILFMGGVRTESGSPTAVFYWFDGVSQPIPVNPSTSIPSPGSDYGEQGIDYDPTRNIFSVWTGGGVVHFFNPEAGAWGKYATGVTDLVPTFGNSQSVIFSGATQLTRAWNKSATDTLRRYTPSGHAASCYLQTSKVGRADSKTLFTRLIPQLRRRTDLGTDSASLEMTLFREREDTTATTTRTIAESTTRKRFDLVGGAAADNFARFKVTWTALDVEVDDFQVISKPAGTD